QSSREIATSKFARARALDVRAIHCDLLKDASLKDVVACRGRHCSDFIPTGSTPGEAQERCGENHRRSRLGAQGTKSRFPRQREGEIARQGVEVERIDRLVEIEIRLKPLLARSAAEVGGQDVEIAGV